MIIDHDERPIERIMSNAFDKLRGLVSADTVIGSAVTTEDGVTVIPVSRVTMGFVTGGGEYSQSREFSPSGFPFAGGSGAGVSVSPVGFLVNDGKSVKLVGADGKGLYDRLVELIPDVVAAFNCGKVDEK